MGDFRLVVPNSAALPWNLRLHPVGGNSHTYGADTLHENGLPPDAIQAVPVEANVAMNEAIDRQRYTLQLAHILRPMVAAFAEVLPSLFTHETGDVLPGGVLPERFLQFTIPMDTTGDIIYLPIARAREKASRLSHIHAASVSVLGALPAQKDEIDRFEFFMDCLHLIEGATRALLAVADDPGPTLSRLRIGYTMKRPSLFSAEREVILGAYYCRTPEEMLLTRTTDLTGSHVQRLTSTLAHFIGADYSKVFPRTEEIQYFSPTLREVGFGVAGALGLFEQRPKPSQESPQFKGLPLRKDVRKDGDYWVIADDGALHMIAPDPK